MCMLLCILQPHPCAQLTSFDVELDAAFVCHGDVMVRMTAPTTVMKKAARRLVRLAISLRKLNLTQALVVVMTTSQNSPLLLTN